MGIVSQKTKIKKDLKNVTLKVRKPKSSNGHSNHKLSEYHAIEKRVEMGSRDYSKRYTIFKRKKLITLIIHRCLYVGIKRDMVITCGSSYRKQFFALPEFLESIHSIASYLDVDANTLLNQIKNHCK